MFRLSPRSWFVIAVINFLLFGLTATLIGGDALNGHIANGQFFIGIHGRYTEVTERRYIACLIWELATFGGLFWAWRNRRRNQLRS